MSYFDQRRRAEPHMRRRGEHVDWNTRHLTAAIDDVRTTEAER